MSEKNMERSLRRALCKAGYQLYKSRQKTPVANNLCGYMIVDSKYNACVGGPNYELDLDDVAAFCKEYCD